MDLFEQAARQKFRFDSPKGALTVEDLWELPLTSTVGKANLDDTARGLHRQLKSDDSISFVTPPSAGDSTIQAKFDLVKHIIAVRQQEASDRQQASEKSAKKQEILALIAKREQQNLEALPEEELRKMLESL